MARVALHRGHEGWTLAAALGEAAGAKAALLGYGELRVATEGSRLVVEWPPALAAAPAYAVRVAGARLASDTAESSAGPPERP